MSVSQPSNEQKPASVIGFIFKWRKVIAITCLIAGVLALVFSSSLFIAPRYRSTVIMYPAATNSISKALLSENQSSEQDLLEFGEDAQTEQMLQILNSGRLRDRIISRFNLADHYGISPNSKYYNTRLQKQYEQNISFKRTEYMAVKISVLDKSPQMAADIANSIASLLDSVKNDMQKERAIEGFRILEDEYNKLQAEIGKMEDSLTEIRKKGVHDYETQAEMINQQLAIEIARGNQSGINALESKLDILAQYGGAYVSLRDAIENEKKQLSYVKARYDEAKIDAQKILPQKFIVQSAYKAEKKAYPVAWLIVLTTIIATFFVTVLVIVAIDQWGDELAKVINPQDKGPDRHQ
jgi:capsular polysaccharide biosynthesis protein